jgi:hypothetical protein
MLNPDEALKLARLYDAAKHISIATVAKHALGTNHKVFTRIEEGHGANARTLLHLETWFRAHWPDNALWPAGIQPAPRPRRAPRCTATHTGEPE